MRKQMLISPPYALTFFPLLQKWEGEETFAIPNLCLREGGEEKEEEEEEEEEEKEEEEEATPSLQKVCLNLHPH